MSLKDKMYEQIRVARTTGQKKAVHGPLCLEESFQNLTNTECIDEYDLRVIFGKRTWIRERKDYEHVVDLALAEIIEFLFGDARSKLRELEMSVLGDADRGEIRERFIELWEELS